MLLGRVRYVETMCGCQGGILGVSPGDKLMADWVLLYHLRGESIDCSRIAHCTAIRGCAGGEIQHHHKERELLQFREFYESCTYSFTDVPPPPPISVLF